MPPTEPAADEPVAPPDVATVLAARLAGHRDEHVVALTVEGGGMRGVVSGGMLLALRDLGLLGVLDRCYGVSSGALNLAYLAAGAGWDALPVYYDHLVHHFVRRAPRPGRPLLDMGRVERILRTELPLDVAAARASALDVRLVLSDVAARRPVVVPLRSAGDRLVEHLLAGAWLPVLAGPPYRIGGRAYLDGGLLWPDPVYAAVAEGATHVLMLSTSPVGGPPALAGATLRVLPRALELWSPGLGAAFLTGNARWRRDNPVLRPGGPVRWNGAVVHRVRPAAGAHGVGRLTRERSALLDGARAGYLTVRAAFGDARPGPGYFCVVAP